jgi:hypothetical protein
MKVVHVELSGEAGEFVVLEVLGEDNVFKLHYVSNDKALTVVAPTDNIFVIIFLRMFRLDGNLP